ncbi:MAG: hypothetical protein H7138_11385, partial [Myxococcales bacterium]|nr:hypothetical protein [Myxococcales bacterium]
VLATAIADSGARFRAALDCSGQSAATSATATLTVNNPAAGVLVPVAITGLREPANITMARGIVREPGGSHAFVSANTIRRLSADRLSITLIAGSTANTVGSTVDGVGDAARFDQPWGITVDPAGTLYVTERNGQTLRRIAVDGTVTTIAGSPQASGSTDGTGSAARFSAPQGVAIGPDGDLYVADAGNSRVRRVTAAGVVTTYAGTSSGYLDAAAASARFSFPVGIAVASDGSVYVSDAGNHRVRRIQRSANAAGNVDTLAGSGNASYPDTADGTGTAAVIVAPGQMALSGSTLYVRDNAGLVRTIDTGSAVVATLAGTVTDAITPLADGPRGAAKIDRAVNGPGVAPGANGGVLITDNNIGAVRSVDASGVVVTLAIAYDPYGASVPPDGTGVLAQAPLSFAFPTAIAAAPDGSIVVGSVSTVRRIAPSGTVSPIIGLLRANIDGTGSAAETLAASQALTVDASGVIYFADASNVRRIDAGNATTSFAGAAAVSIGDTSGQGAVDGAPAAARFSSEVSELTRGAGGDLYAADLFNYAIRRIDAAGNVSTYAGALGQKAAVDGPRATARFTGPLDVAYAPDGSLWVLDGLAGTAAGLIRRVAPDGTVSTLPTRAFHLEVDPAGTIYVISETGDLASVNPTTGALTVLIARGAQLTFGSNPRLGGTTSFTVVGVKQLLMVSDAQLVRATLP